MENYYYGAVRTQRPPPSLSRVELAVLAVFRSAINAGCDGLVADTVESFQFPPRQPPPVPAVTPRAVVALIPGQSLFVALPSYDAVVVKVPSPCVPVKARPVVLPSVTARSPAFPDSSITPKYPPPADTRFVALVAAKPARRGPCTLA